MLCSCKCLTTRMALPASSKRPWIRDVCMYEYNCLWVYSTNHCIRSRYLIRSIPVGDTYVCMYIHRYGVGKLLVGRNGLTLMPVSVWLGPFSYRQRSSRREWEEKSQPPKNRCSGPPSSIPSVYVVDIATHTLLYLPTDLGNQPSLHNILRVRRTSIYNPLDSLPPNCFTNLSSGYLCHLIFPGRPSSSFVEIIVLFHLT